MGGSDVAKLGFPLTQTTSLLALRVFLKASLEVYLKNKGIYIVL